MNEQENKISDLAELERKIDNLTKLVYINGVINSTLDIGKLLTIVMEIIKDIMNTEASTLLLYDEDENNLVFKVALGGSGKDLVEKYRVEMGQGIAGWVAETRKHISINNVYEDKRFDPNFDRETGFTTKSIACTPLLYKGKLIGVIQAINPVNRPCFDENDMNLFNIFANQAALAVQNAVYFHRALEEERLNVELMSAKSFQESLIPDINEKFENIQIAAKTISAREVGGEFHGIYNVNDNISVALCNIHEKGIPGGLNASVMSGALKALTGLIGNKPSKIVKLLNRSLAGEIKKFNSVSFFYGLIDVSNRLIHFVNTGVAYPILVRDGVARYLKFRSRGFDVDNGDIKQVKVKLKPDDIFIIISDSIINVRSRNGQILGLKKVMNFLQNETGEPERIIESLMNFADKFSQGLEKKEDISIVIFKVD